MQLNIDRKIKPVETNFDQIHEQIVNFQQDVNRKSKSVENKLLHVEESPFNQQKIPPSEIKRLWTDFKEEFNKCTKMKALRFYGKQFWTSYRQQFEVIAAVIPCSEV